MPLETRIKTSHLILPDVQAKPGQNFEFLRWAGQYCAEHKPSVIICIGDFADMPSLSLYDVGKKSFEGRCYKDDVLASIEAMTAFMSPIREEQNKLIKNHKPRWNPRFIMTLGNHEARIPRAIEMDRKLDGLISIDDLKYKEFGWGVIPFLETIQIDGVSYCHYFTSGVLGRPISSPRALVMKKHMSCVMGHVQESGIDMSQRRADGTPLIGLFCGSYTPYDEEYLNPQTNRFHRQIWHNREVKDGFFYPHPISITYLRDTYGKDNEYIDQWKNFTY